MADTVLQEFLAVLGFKVDEAGLKKITAGLAKMEKAAGELVAGLEAVAVAAAVAVTKVSSEFEDLYYASQRIGDSVENIRAFGFAMGQMGGSAEGAQRALESVAEWVRSNPAGGDYIRGLGVDLKYVNGQAQITEQAMGQLAGALRAMPYSSSVRVAGMMGIDPRTLQAMLRDTGEFEARYHQIAKMVGIDQDEAAAASVKFMKTVRDVLTYLDLLKDKFLLLAQGPMGQVIDFMQRLDAATGGLSTVVVALGAVLAPVAAALTLFFGPVALGAMLFVGVAAALVAVIGYFSDWRAGLSGIGGGLGDIWEALQPLIQAIKALGVVMFKIGSPMLTALINVAFTLIADVIRLVIDLVTGNWTKAWQDWGRVGFDMFHTMGDALGGLRKMAEGLVSGLQAAWNWLNRVGSGPKAPAAKAPAPAAGPSPQAAPRVANDNTIPQAAAGIAQGIGARVQAYFEAHGYSRAQAAGMTAGAHAESNLNPGAINPTSGAFGIGQWLGGRKADLFKRYGRNPNLDQQLEYMLWELTHSEARAGSAIHGAASASDALSAYVQRFMRPGPGAAGDLARGNQYLSGGVALTSGAAPRGAAPVVVSQTTHITVDGSGDPGATARSVADHQKQVNGEMVRNLRAAAS